MPFNIHLQASIKRIDPIIKGEAPVTKLLHILKKTYATTKLPSAPANHQ